MNILRMTIGSKVQRAEQEADTRYEAAQEQLAKLKARREALHESLSKAVADIVKRQEQ